MSKDGIFGDASNLKKIMQRQYQIDRVAEIDIKTCVKRLNGSVTGDIFTLARAFLSISEMSNKKLQKLCYYAKAWYLALYDVNLIQEQFEAWTHGAVQPELYRKYKEYGFENIQKCDDTSDIPEEFISFANEIYDSYGHLTGNELEYINHREEPWIKARGNCKPWESCSNRITEEDMRSYYRNMVE